jgi:hypothetical protein
MPSVIMLNVVVADLVDIITFGAEWSVVMLSVVDTQHHN